jgi:Na+-driven multidrug efflux pump
MADERDTRSQVPARPIADERGRYVVIPGLVRTDTLINVGLIVLGVYILQAFMSSSVTDVAARVSVAAWAVAIPLLAFQVLLNQVLESYRYASNPVYMFLARGLALGAAVIGFGAAVWHVWMPASIVLIASGLGGLFIYQAYRRRLERDNRP